jgi:hypothetical protein
VSALLPGKEPQYPLERRLDEPQSRSGRGGEEIKSLPLPRINVLGNLKGRDHSEDQGVDGKRIFERI